MLLIKIKKDTLAQVFSCECCEIFIRGPILQSSNKWMKNVGQHYLGEAAHRFSSK